MNREAMQLALEALESDPISHAGLVSRKQAITALRQALVDGGNCYGDGTVYRGQRSKDSAVQTLWLRTRARGEK
jgi:hypothetical protein